MQVIRYSYERDYCAYNDYKATLVVKVSNQELATSMVAHSMIPEYVIRRKLEASIMNKIQDQLFGR